VRNEHHLLPLTSVEMVITAVGLRSIAGSLGGKLSDPASFATKTEPSYQTDPGTWVKETETKRKQTASWTPSRSVVFTFSPSKSVPSPHSQALARPR